jgi:hypothetical protein
VRLEAGGDVGAGHVHLALVAAAIEREGRDGCITYKVLNDICAGV